MLAQFVVDKTVGGGELHQQQRMRHAERGMDLGAVHRRRQFLQALGNVPAGRLRQGTGGVARRIYRGAEKLCDALPHQCHGRHDGNAQQLLKGPGVDVKTFLRRLVHVIQRQYDGPAELAQFKRQFEVPLQVAGIDHLDDQVGRRKGRRRAGVFVHRDRRAARRPRADTSAPADHRLPDHAGNGCSADRPRWPHRSRSAPCIRDRRDGFRPSAPRCGAVLDTASNSVVLPPPGRPTSAMRRRRSPRNKGVRRGTLTSVMRGLFHQKRLKPALKPVFELQPRLQPLGLLEGFLEHLPVQFVELVRIDAILCRPAGFRRAGCAGAAAG